MDTKEILRGQKEKRRAEEKDSIVLESIYSIMNRILLEI